MKIIITRKELIAKEACREGMKMFETMLATQGRKHSIILDWCPLTAAWSAVAMPSFASWIREQFGLRATLTEANLARATLTGANLTEADLTGADLYGATLTGADLYGAYLARADLTEATLTGADLYGAYLARADLTEATLTEATLTGANLTGANRWSDDIPISGWRLINGRLEKNDAAALAGAAQ